MKRSRTVRFFSLMVMTVVALAGFSAADVPTAVAGEANVYLAVDGFTWKEFDNGDRAVKESGTLFGVGLTYLEEFENHMTLKPTAEIFGGTVDYDGQACDLFGTCQPATSKVDYFGIKLEGDVGRRFRSARSSFIEPFGGLGLRAWTRDINNGTAAGGSVTSGYTEDWITLHARLGVRGGVDFSSQKQVFAEVGVKLPLYNENTAYISDIGYGPDVTLHPGKQASFFAETGIKLSSVKASVFYDGLRFSQSSTVSNGVIAAYQPKSTMDIYGVKLGVVF